MLQSERHHISDPLSWFVPAGTRAGARRTVAQAEAAGALVSPTAAFPAATAQHDGGSSLGRPAADASGPAGSMAGTAPRKRAVPDGAGGAELVGRSLFVYWGAVAYSGRILAFHPATG